MEFGAHLPLMDFGGHPYTLDHLIAYTKTAAELGFSTLATNDHMVFSVPWLDGPTALAAMVEHSGEMTLATTVALTVVRGPVSVAKSMGAIDRLSGGRVQVAVGPGSSADDYAAVGLDFAERWPRFDESISALRALWRPHDAPFVGQFYSTEGLTLLPEPAQHGGPPIWIGSWGSGAGLRRVARLGDGWLASAYNTTPSAFGEAWQTLRSNLVSALRIPTPSRMPWRRCGVTSPTTNKTRSACCGNGCFPPCTDPRRSCANGSRSARPNNSPRSCGPSPTPAFNVSTSGPSPMSGSSSSASGTRSAPRDRVGRR